MMIYRHNPLLDANQTISRFRNITRRLERAEQIAITGVAVQRPSDSPGQWTMLHGLRSSLADQQRWQKAMGTAEDLLLGADHTMDAVSSTLKAASDLAIQYANETYDADQRANAATQISTMRDDMLALANTKIGPRYLFAGDAYDSAAFDASATYTGAAASSSIQIGDGQQVQVAFDGSQVFQGSVDVFQVLGDLVTALQNNDTAGITTAIDQIDQASKQVTGAWSDIGYRLSRLEDARSVATSMELLLTERLSNATDADMAEAFTNLTTLQTSYEAALQVTASSSGATLFGLL